MSNEVRPVREVYLGCISHPQSFVWWRHVDGYPGYHPACAICGYLYDPYIRVGAEALASSGNQTQTQPKDKADVTHEHLWSIVKKLPSDFEPYGQRTNEKRGGDCSCGCVHFAVLDGPRGADWGVCTNAQSPRMGLLTFEHMGCPQFEQGAEENNDV